MKTIIFTGGEVVLSSLVKEVTQDADFIIAVDSGAKVAMELGVMPRIVIGDMDSIDNATKEVLEKNGIEFQISPTEKDETDTELGIDYATKNGATEIIIIGGTFGDRIDHILANILYATISRVPITFVNGLQKSFMKKGPVQLSLKGNKKDLLSLIPLTEDVTGISSTGLQWELHDSTLVFGMPRGVSNVFLQEEITLSWKSGWLLVTHTLQNV